jgi:hypothetical protein
VSVTSHRKAKKVSGTFLILTLPEGEAKKVSGTFLILTLPEGG